MALGAREVAMADSLARLLPADNASAYLKAITAALAGDYEGAYPQIASRGGLNEILLLLCMERNATALSKCNEMITFPEYNQNAKFWYIHAVCANRNDDIFTAMISMETALALDPSLEEIGRLDSDAMDVIELVRPSEEGTQY
jgi:hypothetical protein